MKAIITADALLAYPINPSISKPTLLAAYQLGGVIKQDGRLVAQYTRLLSAVQKNSTTMEKEKLSIVEIP